MPATLQSRQPPNALDTSNEPTRTARPFTTRSTACRPVGEVSQYAADPDNAPLWYENIKTVEWKTPHPAQVGSRIDFVAHFLGRRLAYTYEFVEFVPGRRLTMRTPGPPFSMETTYTWEDENGATRMRLRNGERRADSPHGSHL